MFHSCLSDWTFTSKWTMRSLLAHYDDNVTWITDVSVDHKSPIPMKMIDRPEMEKAEGPVVRIYCDVRFYFYIRTYLELSFRDIWNTTCSCQEARS